MQIIIRDEATGLEIDNLDTDEIESKIPEGNKLIRITISIGRDVLKKLDKSKKITKITMKHEGIIHLFSILKGSQLKTDSGPRAEIIQAITLKKYLDEAISYWRKELGISKIKEDKLIAKSNIDAYQSIRISMLGVLKPKEEKWDLK